MPQQPRRNHGEPPSEALYRKTRSGSDGRSGRPENLLPVSRTVPPKTMLGADQQGWDTSGVLQRFQLSCAAIEEQQSGRRGDDKQVRSGVQGKRLRRTARHHKRSRQ